MTTKKHTPGSTIRSHSDLNAQRRFILDRHQMLLNSSKSTLDTIKLVSDEEDKGLSNCCNDLEKVENRLAIVEKNLPEETLADGKISSTMETLATVACPQCKTDAYCISRPIKTRDLTDGHGFSASLLASIRLIKLKWGSHSPALLISCMKCRHQFIQDH
ncbi:MAG: hypothetical protein COA73_03050 [Candidatus Hydrogenedentota bacterium]|nr:MAG: hypothetical protein COA73_03050 [Candidatus Hydrogenedentota bacterium]